MTFSIHYSCKFHAAVNAAAAAVVGKSFSNLGFSTAACPWCARSKSALVMQDDGNLVLYGSSTLISSRYAIRVDGRVLWQTGTGVPAGSKRN